MKKEELPTMEIASDIKLIKAASRQLLLFMGRDDLVKKQDEMKEKERIKSRLEILDL